MGQHCWPMTVRDVLYKVRQIAVIELMHFPYHDAHHHSHFYGWYFWADGSDLRDHWTITQLDIPLYATSLSKRKNGLPDSFRLRCPTETAVNPSRRTPSHGGNTCPTLPTTSNWVTDTTALPCAPSTPAAMPASRR